MGTPFANVLHADTITRLARGDVLGRGKRYAARGRVKALAKKDGQIVAVVQGTTFYAIALWVKGDGIGYLCSCPSGADGDFCKHCVAVAITWLARATPE